MSFIDSAAELIDRTEASLNSLIADALRARAYREIAAIAAMAEAVAGISHARADRRTTAADPGDATPTSAPEPLKIAAEPPKTAADPPKIAADASKTAAEPSWMRGNA